MGKQSTRENKTIYQLCREAAGLTSAEASEKMDAVSDSKIEKFGSGKILFEMIYVFLFHFSGIPSFKVLRFEQFYHVVRRVSHGIQGADNGSHGSTSNVVNRDVVFFQCANDADVRHSFGATTA